MFKKADFFLILLLLAAGFGISFWFLPSSKAAEDSMITITVNDTLYGTYPLSQNQELEIQNESGYNKVLIQGGTVQVEEANCTGQQCVRQGRITSPGQSIVCLPNRVVIQITGGETPYDTIVS